MDKIIFKGNKPEDLDGVLKFAEAVFKPNTEYVTKLDSLSRGIKLKFSKK